MVVGERRRPTTRGTRIVGDVDGSNVAGAADVAGDSDISKPLASGVGGV